MNIPASLENAVGSSPSNKDLRVGNAAVALASSVASSLTKYWVFTNLFPGASIPQVSVYQPQNLLSRNGSNILDTDSSSKDSTSLLAQDIILSAQNHPTTSEQEPNENRNNQALQAMQVCYL